jgi:putative transposase
MARISRVVASVYPHHVTQRGVRSIPIFQTDTDRRAYLDFMAGELDRFGIKVLAWCLMTNHTHLIVVPERCSRVVAGDRRSTSALHAHEELFGRVRGYLFQGRFGFCVLKEGRLWAAALMWISIQFLRP